MQTFYVTCAAFGGVALVIQLALGLLGLAGGHALDGGHGHDHDHTHASDGLNLRSARALTAALTFFGLGGLVGLQAGLGALSLLPAAVLGGVAQYGTAVALRALLRLEQDRTLRLERAVGQVGSVYLAVPAERSGLGKIHVTVQDRLIECAAVSRHAGIPTGASVLVIDLDEEYPGAVVVTPNPQLLEETNAVA